MSRRKIIVLLVVLAAGGTVLHARSAAQGLPRSGKVVDVIDGDTIEIEAKGARYTCRLLGIDAPELSYEFLWKEIDKLLKYTSGRPRGELESAQRVFRKWAKVLERFALKARAVLSGMVKRETVELAYDPKEGPRDKHDRLLVYVSLRGRDVNAEMMRRGLAVADVRFASSRLGHYMQLGRRAKAARVGVWKMRQKDGQPAPEAQVEVWASTRSEKYHLPECHGAKQIAPENLKVFKSVRDAREAGYAPCQSCKPPEE